MAHYNVLPTTGARIGGFVARHPRLVAALLAVLLLLAVQDGAVATDGGLVGTNAEASVDLGPHPDKGD